MKNHIKLRPYQIKAIKEAKYLLEKLRSVCLVAPTGSGKTILGKEIIGNKQTLWVAHRTELVKQAADRLGGAIVDDNYGRSSRSNRINVGTIQSLISSGKRPNAELIVLDEAHHYVAEEWSQLVKSYPDAKVLGLTATPERSDGNPLGDVFDGMVVAASYSELIRDGYLVPSRVYRPSVSLGNDLALDPVDAWIKYAEGSMAFVFCSRVSVARELAYRFNSAGICARSVDEGTDLVERSESISAFREGNVKVLTSVYALTEGVDIPQAGTVILARSFGHHAPYLQSVGRALRPYPGKEYATLIDLTGASHKHGLPNEDRDYSLTGNGISNGKVSARRVEIIDRKVVFCQSVTNNELELVIASASDSGCFTSITRKTDGSVDVYVSIDGKVSFVGTYKPGTSDAMAHEKGAYFIECNLPNEEHLEDERTSEEKLNVDECEKCTSSPKRKGSIVKTRSGKLQAVLTFCCGTRKRMPAFADGTTIEEARRTAKDWSLRIETEGLVVANGDA